MSSPITSHMNEAEISTGYTKFIALALCLVMMGCLVAEIPKIGEVKNLFLMDHGKNSNRSS